MNDTTAYHEAGHAVVACVQGGRIVRITIEPDEDDLYGDTEVAWQMNNVDRKQHILREIRTLMAGPITEAIYTEQEDIFEVTTESSADWLRAAQFASQLFPSAGKQSKLLAQLAQEVRDLIGRDKIWSAIAALADELEAHETLEQEPVEEILEFWLNR